ncbi:MAG: DUF499 domain-containing protein [Chloroflexi bacterium]|nr:DUF499 domain-containing protein [Chloroflexota bacterium]
MREAARPPVVDERGRHGHPHAVGRNVPSVGRRSGVCARRRRGRESHHTGRRDDAQFLRELKQPTLILLDEILNYVEAAHTVTIGDSTFGRQIMVFLKNLTESVAASRNAVVVYSLAGQRP